MVDLERFRDQIRLLTCHTLIEAKGGHIGGSMSIVEVLAVIYGKHMRFDPSNPKWGNRDWFVLSKGHSGPAYYATLSLVGFFDKSLLSTLNHDDTQLPSHPDSLKTRGVDCTTGSLGQGISQAVGVAIALKQKRKDNVVYCIIGDGESNEGQVWEAVQFAVGHKLDNFILFIDDNKNQLDGPTKEVNIELNFSKIMDSFGFYTQVVKGDDLSAIDQAIVNARNNRGSPSAIVLETIKGQGIGFVEKMANNHHIAIEGLVKENLLRELKILEDRV
jgi:transketolase